jgi:hypothetical protein
MVILRPSALMFPIQAPLTLNSSIPRLPATRTRNPFLPPIRDTNPTTVRPSRQRIAAIQRVIDASEPIIAVNGGDAATHPWDDAEFLTPFWQGDAHLVCRT